MSARAKLVDFLVQYSGRCRDCADENGFCPQTGIGCGQRRKAVEFILGAIEYGSKHGFTPGHLILSPDEVRGIREALHYAREGFTVAGSMPLSDADTVEAIDAAIRSLKGGRDAQ